MGERLLKLVEVLKRTSFSKTHTYRLIAAGQHPKPVPLGPGRVAWIESEIDAKVAALIAGREVSK